jgi:nicotinate-nucleotide adenylyltransferase
MILASIAADPRIGVDDLELRRGGVSYTVDTLEEIVDRYRLGEKPALILGDDLAAEFPQWKRVEDITQKAEIVIARRLPAFTLGAGKEFPYPHRRLHNDVVEISSALIRGRIAGGGAWRSLVPPGARFIIEDRGLYLPAPLSRVPGTETAAPLSLVVRVEDAVREALPVQRFLHSRGTALMARDLARRAGLDENAAYLAGVAHDMAKALEPGEIRALAEQDAANGGFSELEREKPDLLHGRAAAVLLRERFGIHNREVLEAVSFHTTGRAGMGDLAKVVFIADKLECSRPHVPPGLRDLAGTLPLDGLLRAAAEDSVRYLREKGMEAAPETLALLN